MENSSSNAYMRGFVPYAIAALLIGLVGGFSTVLGPAFVQDLGLPYNNTTWTALAQAMSAAACAPVLGKLGDALGRRLTLLTGIALFTLGNILTASAGSLLFMLIARFILGAGMAAIAPVVLAYIVIEFPPERISKGFSLYMLISSASVVFGPTLGGLMLTAYGWRAMIWLCAAFSVLAFLACLVLTRREKTVRRALTGFDRFGVLLVPVFFSLVLCIPSFGQNFGWSSMSFLLILAAAVLTLILLIIAEHRAENPILSGSFLRRKAFLLSVLSLFLTQGLLQANMTNTIVFVRYIQPDNTTLSGYAISILYLGMSLGSVVLGPLADRYEPKRVLTGSLLLTGIGCAAMLLFTANATLPLLALSLGILGFGLGGNGTVFMKVALTGVPPAQAGTGTGTYGLFRDLAAPFGVAVFVPMFTNRITALTTAGTDAAAAAVSAIHTLSMVELFCIAGGILAVQFLPHIHKKA